MNTLDILIRTSTLSDLPELQQMFVDSISTICKNDYSPHQIKAWISSIENPQRWKDKINSQYFLIAGLDNKIVGFSSLEENNYLDFLYVHRDYQRQGIANKLYTEIETEAIKRKATVLSADVSKTAKPFFEQKRFTTLSTQIKIIQGVEIINYKMAKQL
jgi:putative acetyltransferase